MEQGEIMNKGDYAALRLKDQADRALTELDVDVASLLAAALFRDAEEQAADAEPDLEALAREIADEAVSQCQHWHDIECRDAEEEFAADHYEAALEASGPYAGPDVCTLTIWR